MLFLAEPFRRWHQLDELPTAIITTNGTSDWSVRQGPQPELWLLGNEVKHHVHWQAINTNGQVVAQRQFSVLGNGKVELPQLPSGFYLWQLRDHMSTTSIKVVVR